MNPEQDVKWKCKDCSYIWYEDYKFHFEECPKCHSKNVVKDDDESE